MSLEVTNEVDETLLAQTGQSVTKSAESSYVRASQAVSELTMWLREFVSKTSASHPV